MKRLLSIYLPKYLSNYSSEFRQGFFILSRKQSLKLFKDG